MMVTTMTSGDSSRWSKAKDDVYQARSILLIPIERTTMEPMEFKLLNSELEP